MLPKPWLMSARRRRMKARMKISPSSASLATSVRKPSPLSSRNSPGSVTRPRTRQRRPEIIVSSPVNPPALCVAMARSPCRSGCTISIAPDSNTKNGTLVSPGSNRTSPFSTLRTVLQERTRLMCAGVRTGNDWVCASSALGTGGEDIWPPEASEPKILEHGCAFPDATKPAIPALRRCDPVSS